MRCLREDMSVDVWSVTHTHTHTPPRNTTDLPLALGTYFCTAKKLVFRGSHRDFVDCDGVHTLGKEELNCILFHPPSPVPFPPFPPRVVLFPPFPVRSVNDLQVPLEERLFKETKKMQVEEWVLTE